MKKSKKFRNIPEILKLKENNFDEIKYELISEAQQEKFIEEIINNKKTLFSNSYELNNINLAIKKKFNDHNKLAEFKMNLRLIYHEKFNKQNNQHLKMLFNIWKKLKGEENPIELIDRKWLEIGFQGSDPSTDFRGAGILALYNLYDFVTKRFDQSYRVYLDATDEIKWYFFAASGVNISGAIIEIIEKDKINFLILEYLSKSKTGDLITLLNDLYEAIFIGFNKFWNQQKHFDFMKFNTLFQKYMIENSLKDINLFFRPNSN